MFPFMASAPSGQVGGWRFVKWEAAVEDRIPVKLRPRYLRWLDKYPWSRRGFGEPHAAVREADTAVSLDDLATIMMYCHLSLHSRFSCTRDSFIYREVRARLPGPQRFPRIRKVNAAPFHAIEWNENLLVALSKVFAQAPSLDQGELLPRIRRAIILHNEAYWLWDTERPVSTVFFVLTLALAFEALFTPARRPKSDETPGISATVRQELKGLLLHGRRERYYERGLKKWWNAFYDLRSRIAHGRTVSEDDFLALGKKKGRHHAMVARQMLGAVVYSLLAKQGLCPADPLGLAYERHVKPALDQMVPNGVRFDEVSDIVSNMFERGKLKDDEDHERERELDNLLCGIQDWDMSFTEAQERRLTAALVQLLNNEARLPLLSRAVRRTQVRVELLRALSEQVRSRPPRRLL